MGRGEPLRQAGGGSVPMLVEGSQLGLISWICRTVRSTAPRPCTAYLAQIHTHLLVALLVALHVRLKLLALLRLGRLLRRPGSRLLRALAPPLASGRCHGTLALQGGLEGPGPGECVKVQGAPSTTT